MKMKGTRNRKKLIKSVRATSKNEWETIKKTQNERNHRRTTNRSTHTQTHTYMSVAFDTRHLRSLMQIMYEVEKRDYGQGECELFLDKLYSEPVYRVLIILY